MTRQLIVAVFNSVVVAERAARDLMNVSEKDEGFKIELGLVVQKDATGKLTVLEREPHSFFGALFSGPATKDMLETDFVTSVTGNLAPDAAAVILRAQEATPFDVDNIVRADAGTVYRKDAD
jgi:hypothetical protein